MAGKKALQTGFISDAVTQAGPYVWGAYHWQFRRKEEPLVLTGSQEYVDLPDDFHSFKALTWADGTDEGWPLTYQAEDVYEYENPNPAAIAAGQPKSVKVVFDGTTDKWRIYMTPIPDSAYSPSLIYFRKFGAISEIPMGFEKMLVAACYLFLYPAGSQDWQYADIAYNKAKQEVVKDIDPVYQGLPSRVQVPPVSRFAGDW
jgi:hypothetical protein